MTTEWGTLLLVMIAISPRTAALVKNRGQVRYYDPVAQEWVTDKLVGHLRGIRVVDVDMARNRQKETFVYSNGAERAWMGED